MKETTQKLIERYYDGELESKKAKEVEAAIEAQPELRQSLAKLEKTGELLRLMNEEMLADVSFEGFAERVAQAIRKEKKASIRERITVWIGEFVEHRRVVWVPSVVVASLAVAVLVVMPLMPSKVAENRAASGSSGTWEASAAGEVATINSLSVSSSIDTVDYGDVTGMKYEVRNGPSVIGVVWVVE